MAQILEIELTPHLSQSFLCVIRTGVLMGIAIRTGSPLSLSLAEGVWRQLAGQPLRPQDLAEVDKDFLPALLCIRDMTHHNKVI